MKALLYSPSCPGLRLQSQHSCEEAAFSHHLGLRGGGSAASRGVGDGPSRLSGRSVEARHAGSVSRQSLFALHIPTASPLAGSRVYQAGTVSTCPQGLVGIPSTHCLGGKGGSEGDTDKPAASLGQAHGQQSGLHPSSVYRQFTHWAQGTARGAPAVCSERRGTTMNRTVFTEQQSGRKDRH